MWNGKKKAITFSFDDGVTQDVRLIAILDRYGLKATFNLNSGSLGRPDSFEHEGKIIIRNKNRPSEVKEIYKNHEVACHTVTHTNLTTVSDDTIVLQVNADRDLLEQLSGQPVIGLAYPCGGVNNNDHVAEVVKTQTKIAYARTTTSTHAFNLPKNPWRWDPSIYWMEKRELILETVRRFLESKSDEPQLLYIWGHAYEMDYDPTFDAWFEDLCKMLGNRDDIFYGTNREILGV